MEQILQLIAYKESVILATERASSLFSISTRATNILHDCCHLPENLCFFLFVRRVEWFWPFYISSTALEIF